MDTDLTDGTWTPDPDDGFIGHVGGLWRREIGGKPEFAFVAQNFHANRNGVVHGGMLMTFIDRAFGHATRLASGAPRGTTVSLAHQFLTPAKIGDLVQIAPQITKATTRLVFVTGTAFIGDAPVISAQGVWRITRSTG